MQELAIRHPRNPVLERDTIAGYDALFNPGAMRFNGKIVLAVRAARDNRWFVGATQRSNLYSGQVCDHLLLESDDDGETFKCTGRKITGSSSTWFDGSTRELAIPTCYGPYGTEDMRLCRVGEDIVGVVHAMTHEAYRGSGDKAGGRVGLVVTRDFMHFRRWVVGPGGEETDRDAWIIDRGNDIAFIHRVKPDEAGRRRMNKPSIQVAFFDNLDELIGAHPGYWREYLDSIHEHVIMSPCEALSWESEKIGAGAIVEHEAGYVLFYHGVDERSTYSTGAALLDKDDLRTIARLQEPLLQPHAWYERGDRGEDTKNVTFIGGAVRCQNDPKRIQLYYGAADTHVARADVPNLDELVEAILRSPIRGVYG